MRTRVNKPINVTGATIFEKEKELRKKALEASKNHVENGKVKYLLKN